MGRPLFLLLLSAAVALRASADRAILFVRHREESRAALRAELAARSDPASPLFLRWLSPDEVVRIFRPAPEHIAAATAAALRHGAASTAVVGGDKIEALWAGPVPAAFLNEAAAMQALDHVAATARTRPHLRQGHRSAVQPPIDVSLGLRRRHDFVLGGENATATSAADASDPQACLAAMLGITPTCIRTAVRATGAYARACLLACLPACLPACAYAHARVCVPRSRR